MSEMNWPTNRTFRYPFREEKDLDLVMPLINGKNKEKVEENKTRAKGR